MLTYQHFLQQMTAAAQQHQAAAAAAATGRGAAAVWGVVPALRRGGASPGSLFRPTAVHAAQPTAAPVVPGASAAPAAPTTSEEKTAVAA